jgi:C-terminal processing protease CtpA/Prc
VVPGSPAAESGAIRADDVLLAVDGQARAGRARPQA